MLIIRILLITINLTLDSLQFFTYGVNNIQ